MEGIMEKEHSNGKMETPMKETGQTIREQEKEE